MYRRVCFCVMTTNGDPARCAQSSNQSQDLSLLTGFLCCLLLCLVFCSLHSSSFTAKPSSTSVQNVKAPHTMVDQSCIKFSPQDLSHNHQDLHFPRQWSITDLGTSQHPAQAVQKTFKSIITHNPLLKISHGQTIMPFNERTYPYRIFNSSNLENARREVALQLYI